MWVTTVKKAMLVAEIGFQLKSFKCFHLGFYPVIFLLFC